jgi:hypothetical protein
VRRIAERISENLCVRDGAVAWKSADSNQIQGWDDYIAILQELICEVIRQEREMNAHCPSECPVPSLNESHASGWTTSNTRLTLVQQLRAE